MTVRHRSWAGPIFQSCPRASGVVQRLGYSLGYSRGGTVLILDRLLFRHSGLPVRLIRSKRGWMLSCVRDRGWLVPLLSAAGSTGSRGMLTAMPADLPCRRARNGYGRCSLAPGRCCLRNSLGSQKPTGSASHVCPIGTESVTHEPFGAGGAEPTTRLGPFAGRQMT